MAIHSPPKYLLEGRERQHRCAEEELETAREVRWLLKLTEGLSLGLLIFRLLRIYPEWGAKVQPNGSFQWDQ